ncbi:MAG: copper resistance protein B [Methylophilaceae bacterium]|nr:copper resistance protein B [Methylophilaceae bacterium]
MEALWNRTFATHWSTQIGIRHDAWEGPSRTWLAFGIEGLVPYWFDIEATAYIGENGRTAFRGEIDYKFLPTQRFILQLNIEINIYSKNDKYIGSGLSAIEARLRLRYKNKMRQSVVCS